MSSKSRLVKVERTTDSVETNKVNGLADILNALLARAGLRICPPGAPGEDVIFTADDIARGKELVDLGGHLEGLSDGDLYCWVAYHDSLIGQ